MSNEESGLEDGWEDLTTSRETNKPIPDREGKEVELEEDSKMLEQEIRTKFQEQVPNNEFDEKYSPQSLEEGEVIPEQHQITELLAVESELKEELPQESPESFVEPSILRETPNTEFATNLEPIEAEIDETTIESDLHKLRSQEEQDFHLEKDFRNSAQNVLGKTNQSWNSDNMQEPMDLIDPNFELYVVFGTLSILLVHSMGLLTPFTRLCC